MENKLWYTCRVYFYKFLTILDLIYMALSFLLNALKFYFLGHQKFLLVQGPK